MDKKIFQWEIWWIDPTPKVWSEQRWKRPALIIQNDLANKYLNTTIVAIISSSWKIDMPEMVLISDKYWLSKWSYADFAQIFTIDKRRLINKIWSIDSNDWSLIEEALGTIFMKTMK